MGKERLIPLIAIAILVLGSTSTIYVYATTTNTNTLTINNQTYTYSQLQQLAEPRTIETYTGIALDDLIINTGIQNPTTKKYTIIGSDHYQKTIQWIHLQNGLLTPNGEVIFSDLPKAFRVKNVIQIEVN